MGYERCAHLIAEIQQRLGTMLNAASDGIDPAGVGLTREDLRRALSHVQDLAALLEDQQGQLRHMQHDLTQMRSRYATLYHGSPMGIITLDSSMRITEINRTAVLMLNYPREQVLRQDVRSFIHTDDQEIFFRHRQLLHTTHISQQCELRMRRADGTPVVLHIEMMLPSQPADTSLPCLLFLWDISQQKRYEAQQHEYALRLQQVTKHSPHVLWLRDVENQQVLAITPSFAWLPQAAIDYFAKTPASFIHVVHPEDTERLSRAFHRQKQTGGVDEECRLIGKDGAVYQVHVRTFPVYDEQGNIYRIAGVAEDITTRKQAEEERDRLRQQVREVRRAAERATERMVCLIRTAERLTAVTDPAQIADVLVKEIAIQSGVTQALVFQLNDEHTALHLVSSSSVARDDAAELLPLDHTIPLSMHTPYTTVVQSGQPRWDDTPASLLAEFPDGQPRASSTGACATLPLLANGSVCGVLLLAFAEAHEFNPEERTFFLALAQQCAQTLTRCQLQDKVTRSHVQLQALSRNLLELQQQPAADSMEEQPARQVRVVLVDEHTLIREALQNLLASFPTVQVIGEAASDETALRIIADEQPDIVLIDITIGENGGLVTTKQITDRYPDVRVIVFSGYTHAEYVLQALQSGADGYLVKHAQTHDLHTAIESVLRGDTYLSPQISRHVVEGYRGRVGNTALKELLSPRQLEVVRLLVNGATTQTIAGELNISVKTVEAHRTQAMKRLGIKDMTALVRYAIRMGWVSSE
jgi:PAS domain S-box-containing protein